jgi:ankyrin repeat protein
VNDTLKDAKRPETKTWVKNTLRKYIINDFKWAVIVRPSDSHLLPLIDKAPQWIKDAYKREELYYVYTTSDAARKNKIRVTNPSLGGIVDLEADTELILDYFDSPDGPKRPEAILYDDALKKAKEWEKSLEKEVRDRDDLRGIKIVQEVGKYRWVLIKDRSSLDREGDEMHHCVDASMYDSDYDYYSLRDEKNKPHATIEYYENDEALLQLKGYQNGPIEPKLKSMVKDFLKGYLVIMQVSGEGNRDLEKNGWDPVRDFNGLKRWAGDDDGWDDEYDDDYDEPNEYPMSFEDIVDHIDGQLWDRGEIQYHVGFYSETENINKQDPQNGYTFLHYACNRGRLDYVTELLDLGADPNVIDDYGENPLFTAIRRNMEGIESLLNKVQINYQNEDKETALIAAINWKVSWSIIETLLTTDNLDINIKDKAGQTALHHMLYTKDYIRLKGLFDDYPFPKDIDVNAETHQGNTPLMIAAGSGDLKSVELLIKYGARTDGRFGKNAYQNAKMKNARDIMEYLEGLGVKP